MPDMWESLAAFKKEGSFPSAYPSLVRRFWAGRDQVHEVLKAVVGSAQHSLCINMFGFDDDDLDLIIRTKLDAEHVFVQLSLDKSQAGGVHERAILAGWDPEDITNSVAIGTSAGHAISHLKMVIVDGIYTISGSTNWSTSGESLQDNELTVTNDPLLAAEARTILDINHQVMRTQQAAAEKKAAVVVNPSPKA